MNFWLAPLAAFGSRSLYRQVTKASIGKGFLYLLYLSAILNAGVLVWSHIKVVPVLERELGRVIRVMPVIHMSEEGLSIDRPSPYTVPILEWEGQPLVALTFDTSKGRLTPEEIAALPEITALLTQKAFYVKQAGQGVRTIDFDAERQKNPGTFKPLTLDLKEKEPQILKAVSSLKWSVSLTVFGIGLLGTYVSGLLGALIVSLFGLLFNLLRKTRLPYAGLLNLSFFVMTPAYLGGLLLLFWNWNLALAFAGGWLGFLVTLGYLFFAVRFSEEPLPTLS